MRKINTKPSAKSGNRQPSTGDRNASTKALAAELAAKQAAELAAKQAAEPAEPVKLAPVKPDAAEREAASAAKQNDRAVARLAAAAAVKAFYSGSSKPFKSAADTFKPLNPANQKPGDTGLGTTRQAALLLAMLTYSDGNIQPDGTFVRGGFHVPAKLVFDADTLAKRGINPDSIINAQPESGCLGNALGLTLRHVSGPTSGKQARDGVYRIDIPNARKLVSACFGDKHAALLDTLSA